jgi:hypothetical protein
MAPKQDGIGEPLQITEKTSIKDRYVIPERILSRRGTAAGFPDGIFSPITQSSAVRGNNHEESVFGLGQSDHYVMNNT